MSIGITFLGVVQLEKKLKKLNALRFEAVVKKNTVQLFNYMKSGHTPVKTGEMRQSLQQDGKGTVGYTKEYAPHVEFGHRTIGGGWVPGQFFLKQGVIHQREIYRADLINAIKKEGG